MVEMILAQAANNPAIANNPNARSMLEVVQSGDSKRGEQIANNLLKTYGMTKEEALQPARGFFHL